MTDFYYNNEERLKQLREEVFGEKGRIEQKITTENLDVYMFLISMSMEMNMHMNRKSYNRIREEATYIDGSTKNRVFFEKCESYSRDILYFQNFMKETSKKNSFISTYYTFFYRAA